MAFFWSEELYRIRENPTATKGEIQPQYNPSWQCIHWGTGYARSGYPYHFAAYSFAEARQWGASGQCDGSYTPIEYMHTEAAVPADTGGDRESCANCSYNEADDYWTSWTSSNPGSSHYLYLSDAGRSFTRSLHRSF